MGYWDDARSPQGGPLWDRAWDPDPPGIRLEGEQAQQMAWLAPVLPTLQSGGGGWYLGGTPGRPARSTPPLWCLAPTAPVGPRGTEACGAPGPGLEQG